LGTVATLVVEDGPDKSPGIETDHHFCWRDIDNDLGQNAWIISRQDSAIRSYGFWKAHTLGAHFVLTLDDDCRPVSSHWVDEHVANITGSIPRWCNSAGQRTRGMPYDNCGSIAAAISCGLWQGVPDFDAVQSLAFGVPEDFMPPRGTRIIPAGQFFPLCGMNLAFTRAAAPLMYFPLMGKNSPFCRFDDIWCGVIAKHICDHLQLRIACGEPFVQHIRASNVFTNLMKEAPGIAANEHFWRTIADIQLMSDSPTGCMNEVGSALLENRDAYTSRLGTAIGLWAELFQ